MKSFNEFYLEKNLEEAIFQLIESNNEILLESNAMDFINSQRSKISDLAQDGYQRGSNFVKGVIRNAPEYAQDGYQRGSNFVKGVIQNAPEYAQDGYQRGSNFVKGAIQNAPEYADKVRKFSQYLSSELMKLYKDSDDKMDIRKIIHLINNLVRKKNQETISISELSDNPSTEIVNYIRGFVGKKASQDPKYIEYMLGVFNRKLKQHLKTDSINLSVYGRQFKNWIENPNINIDFNSVHRKNTDDSIKQAAQEIKDLTDSPEIHEILAKALSDAELNQISLFDRRNKSSREKINQLLKPHDADYPVFQKALKSDPDLAKRMRAATNRRRKSLGPIIK